MGIELSRSQLEALKELESGSILCGGVGSGKSRVALARYFIKECGGSIKINSVGSYKPMTNPIDLYIITTAKKRDSLEWETEMVPFLLSTNHNICNVKVVVDSWQNIKKYTNVNSSYFIFDEQRVVGSGTWTKSFLKIAKQNDWILLSATPGDTWLDYIPVFIANGFYKNRTEFIRRHVVYSNYTKFPKVDHYVECGRLIKIKNSIVVNMDYKKTTIQNNKTIYVSYDKENFDTVLKKRWNPFTNKPIKNVSELCYTMRKVVNIDNSRIKALKELLKEHDKIIVFYNFDYELDMLRNFCNEEHITFTEWNGHKHEKLPKTNKWIYLVQYTSGAEGWNCIETNCIVFYSQNYSFKTMVQAAGRIDRRNTPFKDLYCYHLRSTSLIDLNITKCLKKKENFNVHSFDSYMKDVA